MKFFCALAFLAVLGANVEAKEVVCYIPTWVDITSYVDTKLCTMFMISFGDVNADGSIRVPDLSSFKRLQTPTSKLLLALGGATAGVANFRAVAATPASRENFAKNCLNVVKQHGLDGIDMDWEFPESYERTTFAELHQAIRDKFGSKYLLTTAVMPGNWRVRDEKVYDIAALGKSCDFINLMSYDYHADASWDYNSGIFFNAPIRVNGYGDSVENGIKLFIEGGAPASKLNVGTPFYGRTYTLSSPSQNKPGDKWGAGGTQIMAANTPSYHDYCKKIADPSYTKKRDSLTMCPYMYKGTEWIAYEDEQSIKDKGDLANKYGLGGVMTWALHQDDYSGVCSSCKWPLLKALNSAIGRAKACDGSSSGGNGGNVVVIPTTTQKATTKKADGGNNGGNNNNNNNNNGGGSTTIITKCPSTGTLPHPDCSKFYSCGAVGSAPYEMSCGSLQFDKVSGTCGWVCNN
ncbi:chitinase-3-like protein 2 [Culicoides brevitarsis]|uniref:chitinase-3-like protein 2 n=1 Tax=Culicoides brevitarsis TaxID=469753 RepID=UPI00307C2B9A